MQGLPDMSSGTAVYDITPADFAAYAKEYLALGFSIFGGCCGTNPDYIRSVRSALEGQTVPQPEAKRICALCSGTRYVELSDETVFGARVSPSDNEDLADALAEEDVETIVELAMEQADEGAEIIYVNLGMPDVEEAALLPTAVREMQGVIDLPLQLDSRDPAALEAALRCYNGTPLVSLSTDPDSLTVLLPIAARYGAMVTAAPEDGADSLAETEKLVSAAAACGMPPERILMENIPENQKSAVLSLGVQLDPSC